jgi:hypothetical protein
MPTAKPTTVLFKFGNGDLLLAMNESWPRSPTFAGAESIRGGNCNVARESRGSGGIAWR